MPESTVLIADGKVEDVLSNERFSRRQTPSDDVVYDLGGANLSAGFIDTHIHGLHGCETSDGTVESVLEVSRALLDYGVTGFCPTLYPQELGAFTGAIRACADAIGSEPGAKILGLHLEGPFISREQIGVHNPDHARAVDLSLMERFREASRDRIAIMTVAPELKGMRELALHCAKSGIVLSTGHSNATYSHTIEGMQAGILHATHLYNAMRRMHHRDPGVVGAVLMHPNVSCEIIADGMHVHPALIRLLLRQKPLDKVVLVTDSIGPNGQQSGDLVANGQNVILEEDAFVRASDGVLAGSALTMVQGVRNLTRWGIPLEDSLRMATANPSNLLGRNRTMGYILPGHRADIVVFDKDFRILMTLVGGQIRKTLF